MSAPLSGGVLSLLVGPVAADSGAAQSPASGEAFGSLLAGALPQLPDETAPAPGTPGAPAGQTPAKDGRKLPDGPGALDAPAPTRGRGRHAAATQDPAAPAPADSALATAPTAAQLVSVPLVLRPDLKPSTDVPASSGAVSALGSTASSAPGGLATTPVTTGPAAGAPASTTTDPASTGNRNDRADQPVAATKAAPEPEAPRGVRGNRPTPAPAPGGTPEHLAPETVAAGMPPTPAPSPAAPAAAVSAPSSVAAASVPAAQPALETALAHVRTRPSGTHELTVQLHPADLGAVRVIARLSGDQLDVTVLCADHAAQQAVAAAVPTLHSRLAELKHVDITGGDLAGTPNQTAGSFGGGSGDRPQGGTDRQSIAFPGQPADRPTGARAPADPRPQRRTAADARFDRRI